jgi:putative hydrolase of the HAD superfamily
MSAIPPHIRAVFFDAVGTLIFPQPPAAKVYAEIGRRFGSHRSEETISERFKEAFAAEEAIDRANGFLTDERRELARWRRIVASVLDDVADPEACFHALHSHFARPQAWDIHPEVGLVLAGLTQRGLLVGMASNYDQRLRLVAAGLEELASLDALVISSEVGWRKPAQGFFAALCRSVDLPASQILFVGDDWDNDYLGGSAAGLETLLFDARDQHAGKKAERIRALHELVQG